MKKIVLSLILISGIVSISVGKNNRNSINEIYVSDPGPGDPCYNIAAQIFFFLVEEEGMHPNQANEVATAYEALCETLKIINE